MTIHLLAVSGYRQRPCAPRSQSRLAGTLQTVDWRPSLKLCRLAAVINDGPLRDFVPMSDHLEIHRFNAHAPPRTTAPDLGLGDALYLASITDAERSFAEASGVESLGRFVAYGVGAVELGFFGLAPVSAVHEILERAGWTISDLERAEINRARRAQEIPTLAGNPLVKAPNARTPMNVLLDGVGELLASIDPTGAGMPKIDRTQSADRIAAVLSAIAEATLLLR